MKVRKLSKKGIEISQNRSTCVFRLNRPTEYPAQRTKIANTKEHHEISRVSKLRGCQSSERGGKKSTNKGLEIKMIADFTESQKIIEQYLQNYGRKSFFTQIFTSKLSMKCEIRINRHRVSLKCVLFMWSSSGNYLLEYVSHQNKVIIQERRRHGSQETEKCRNLPGRR